MTINETLVLPPERDDRWTLARQIGVSHAATRLPNPTQWRGTDTADLAAEEHPWEYETLMHLQQRFENFGLQLVAIEDIYPPLEQIRLGTDREAGLDAMQTLVKHLGALDIPILCYTWSAVFNWIRTSTSTPSRGGSLTTTYNHDLMTDAPPVAETVTEAELWKNLEYFLDQLVPIAEDAGVNLALHPDDPPVSPIRGVPRILTSPEAIERALDLHESDRHGLTFCQGTFRAMGADMTSTIRRFADDVHYVHFRDVQGSARNFTETWHDNGPTDMGAAIETWDDVGFSGPMRPDHVPTLVGESNDEPGYETKGRIFAIGYMRGLLETHTE